MQSDDNRSVEAVPCVEIATHGELVMRAADIEFQIAEDGSIGVSAEVIQQMAGGLAISDVVWFRPVTQPQAATCQELTVLEEPPLLIELLDGALVLDTAARDLYVGGVSVNLAKREYDLLLFLVKNSNRVMSRAQSYETVWGDNIGRENDTNVNVHIGRIRQKLGDYSWTLVTKRGVGYMFSCGEELNFEHPLVHEADADRESVSIEQALTPSVNSEIIFAGGRLIIDNARRDLVIDGQRIAPNKQEYDLLFYLAQNRGIFVTTSQMGTAVWGDPYIGNDNVRVAIANVRKRLGGLGMLIRNLRGVGYMLDETVLENL